MAVNVEGNAIVRIDGQDAAQEMDALKTKAKNFRKELREIRKEKIIDQSKLKKVNTELKKTNQEIRAMKKNSFDYQKVLNNLSGASIRDLTKLQSKLNFETKMLGRNTVEYAKKSAHLKSVTAELKKVRVEMMGINKQGFSFGKMADGFNRYMGAVMGIGATIFGIIMGIRTFISAYNDFEERSDNLSALTGLTGKNIEYLEARALSLSTTTTDAGIRITQSANDIVDGFTRMGSKRPDLLAVKEDLAAVTEDAIILSQAAKGDLDPAVNALAISLNQFNAEASESRRFINAIAAGSQAGAGDIPYIADAIERLGTSANLMNVSFEESIALVETVAPFYKKARVAGNSLDKVLMKMKKHNIGYASGVFDVNNAIDELRERYAKGETSAELFGVEHAKLGELLVMNQDKFNYYTKRVTGTNTAIEQAIINTSNNNAKLAQAKNRTEEQAIALGEKLAPALTFSTNSVRYLLKALTVLVDNFGMIKKIIGITVLTILAYTLVTKGATIATRAKAIAMNVLTAAQKAFNVAAKANPWGVVVAVIVAATAALIAFSDELKSSTKLQQLSNDIASETQKKMAQEATQLEIIKRKLADTNTTQAERKELIGEINDKYGSYLPNLLTENSSLEDIEKAYKAINKQIKRKIELQVTAEKAQEVYREIIDKKDKLSDYIGDVSTSALGNAANIIGTMMFGAGKLSGAAKLMGDIEELEKVYTGLVDKMAEGAFDDLNKSAGSQDTYKPTTPSPTITPSSDKIKKASQDRIKALDEIYKFIISKEAELEQLDPYSKKIAAIDSFYDELLQKAIANNAGKEIIDQLEQLRNEELSDLALQNALDTEQAIFDLKKKYGLLTEDELLKAELDAFENAELFKTLTVEEQEKARDKIKDKYHKDEKARIKEQEKITQAFLSKSTEILGAAIVGNNEVAKEGMRTFLMMSLDMLKRHVIMMIAAATAKEIGTKGFIGIGTAAVLTGLINLAYGVAKGAISGFHDGGFTSQGNSKQVAGVVHKNEYVVSEKMMNNSAVSKIVGALENHRTGGSLDFSAINNALNNGFAEGGYTSAPVSSPSSNTGANNLSELITEFIKFKIEISNWQSELRVLLSYSDIEEVSDNLNEIKTEVTF